jgi:hypothetical protein
MFGMSISSVSSIVTKKTASLIIPDTPYLYYTFDQADVDGTNVLNRVSELYDASLSTAGLLDSSNNISGTTDLSLNASTANQFVTINSAMDIGKSTGLSILLWVRYGVDISSGTRIFDFGNDPASDNIELFIDSIGIPTLSIYSGSTPYTYSFGYPISTHLYRHLGITMSANGTFNYYVDGVLYRTTTGNQYPADIVRTKNYIGKSSNNALFYNGGIGEIRIYNNTVSSDVVLNNMNTNVRLYTNSFMTHNYGFKYSDLLNGRIKNTITGVYDASFLAPVDTTFNINSGTGTTLKQIGITTGTQKYNQATPVAPVTSRINSNFLYNLPTSVLTGVNVGGQSGDWNYGVRILNGFTTPATGGFTVNFFFYILTNTSISDLPYFSFNNGNTTIPITRRITFGMNGVFGGIAGSGFWLNMVTDVSNNKSTIPGNLGNNSGWYQYSLVVNYDEQTIKSYINVDANVFTHFYMDYSNTTFDYCTLMNDITYAGFDYNRPIRGFMNDFRIYNVPLKLNELRQLGQIPVIPAAAGSRVYSLRPMAVAAPVNGNVAVYMDSSVNRIYLSAGVGNLYVGNIATSAWTQSTLAAGSPGQLHNRNWRDIVCDGTGQYVVACVRTTLDDPSGTVFYSSDYGNTYTQTASVIDTPYCFNLAMSNDGNITYMTAWGVPTPQIGGNVNYAYGNLYVSNDKGINWTKIFVDGTGITGGTPSWASMPSQVRCNSTGQYLLLGAWGGCPALFITNNNGVFSLVNSSVSVGSFGLVTTNPMVKNRNTDGTLSLAAFSLGRVSTLVYGIGKNVISPINRVLYSTNCQNTPMPAGIAPATTSAYPWTGARNICMDSDGINVVIVDTAGSGNVFVSKNGVATALWAGGLYPGSPPTVGIAVPATQDIINLSTVPNVVSQTAVPRSAWCGLCVNYTDHFAFANKTGTVYIYSWTLQ